MTLRSPKAPNTGAHRWPKLQVIFALVVLTRDDGSCGGLAVQRLGLGSASTSPHKSSDERCPRASGGRCMARPGSCARSRRRCSTCLTPGAHQLVEPLGRLMVDGSVGGLSHVASQLSQLVQLLLCRPSDRLARRMHSNSNRPDGRRTGSLPEGTSFGRARGSGSRRW